MPVAYEEDFYSWTQEQAGYLREGRLDLLDLAHLAEEVESMGRSEVRELISRLGLIVGHLLKLQVQTSRSPAHEQRWQTSIETQRADLADHLAENPGLKNPAILEKAMIRAWRGGRDLAIRESGLEAHYFPRDCPFTLDQLLDDDYWP